MVEICFIFPVEEDAHKANYEMSKFFQGSKIFIENNLIITPVKKKKDEKNRPMWFFYLDISQNEEDNKTEKYIEISGGLLNLVNKGRDVWAFS